MPSKTPKKKSPLSWDEKIARLRDRGPRELTATIPDEDAQRAILDARAALAQARREVRHELDEPVPNGDPKVEDHPKVAAAKKAIEQAEAEAADLALEWTFRALPPDVYDTLSLDFPPTAEQRELGMEYDNKKYVPALLAACSVQPITYEQAYALCWGDPDAEDEADRRPTFNQAEVGTLFATATAVNNQSRVVLGKASATTRS